MFTKIQSILTLLVVVTLTQQQDPECPSNWQLSNLIQTTALLTISQSADPINQTFNYPFGASYFDKKPSSVLSISNYDCLSFDDIDFSITPQINDAILTINFKAKGMKWSSAKVHVWLNARSDLITGLIITDNLNTGSLQNKILTVDTDQPVRFYQDTRTWYLNYITGIRATSEQGIYDVNTSAYSKSQNTYTIEILAGPETSLQAIQISYLVFNLQISLFSSGGGYISESSLVKPTYKKVHKNFIPMNYQMFGFDKLKIKRGIQFDLHLSIDVDYILEAKSQFGVEYIRIVYLTIGQKTNKVCQSCNNFIYRQFCIDGCPVNTYPFLGYLNGGKSCLTCSPKVFEEINDQKTGCKCIEGFQRNGTGLCVLDDTTKSIITGVETLTPEEIANCEQNQTFINGRCQCDNKSIRVAGGKCAKCQPGSFKHNQSCVLCLGNCLSCQNATSCDRCEEGFSFNLVTRRCENDIRNPLSCGDNQIVENGVCVCDEFSVRQETGECFKCVDGSFKNGQTCFPCILNCLICTDEESCDRCVLTFVFNPITKSCDRSALTTETADVTCNAQENQTLNEQLNKCECKVSFLNVSNQCVCPSNFIFDSNLGICILGPTQSTGDQTVLVESCGVDEVFDGEKCIFCRNGTFPNQPQNICAPCIDFCTHCTDGINCLQCQEGFEFNPSILSCQQCGQNQKFENGRCFCDEFSILEEGQCVRCGEGKFKTGDTCTNCLENCLQCQDSSSCSRCTEDHQFNSITSNCENQTLISQCIDSNNKTFNENDNQCVCLPTFIDVQGKCQCPETLSFSQETKSCISECGNSKEQDGEECDDGNTEDTDGCSAGCTVEPGFICIDGKCSYNFRIVQNRIISNGIVSEFESPDPLTKDELNDAFMLEIEDGPKPKQTKIFQPNGDDKRIKVFQQYCLLPPQNVTITYHLKKDDQKQKKIMVNYDLQRREIEQI